MTGDRNLLPVPSSRTGVKRMEVDDMNTGESSPWLPPIQGSSRPDSKTRTGRNLPDEEIRWIDG